MDELALVRALHVLCVVHWIGGLAFVTLIVLPIARTRDSADEALALFGSVERRFSVQVRITIPIVGVTGFWMTYQLDLWERFFDPAFWWMAAMLGLWIVFMLMVFVTEPLFHATFDRRVGAYPTTTLRRISQLHLVLLVLAAITNLGVVAGVHGFLFF